ncbi:hypothetical protein IFM89_032398 [Coptis chinensis]|uniref:Uncharacterized protein n=1 Tax=Coptis chinensis TaxID=261450 RepID=A0A835HYP8_9MAGN|nr:hypothetical protein IFM89_032398 [Coptis chinensis]
MLTSSCFCGFSPPFDGPTEYRSGEDFALIACGEIGVRDHVWVRKWQQKVKVEIERDSRCGIKLMKAQLHIGYQCLNLVTTVLQFAVGSWEHKEVVRHDRAAGESACTALVAVIVDWFQANQDLMPIRTRFPDKHFDLDIVLQAKIRPLTVAPEKSFIGFFHPDGMEEGGFDFLHGAMSFDGICDEISRTMSNCPSNGSPQIYIVTWNNHFFVLKVDLEAYYIIDTG